MTKVNNVVLSPDEIVATLRNSTLPTLLVEGKSDMHLFHALEDICFANSVDVLPIGGRPALFEVYNRRLEFRHASVAFLADSDMFIFDIVPSELAGIIFTHGYSIENDMLLGGKAFRLISKKNQKQWREILSVISHWFASIVHRSRSGQTVTFSYHPSRVVDFSSGKFLVPFDADLIDVQLLCSASKLAVSSPERYLRGHTLLDALSHFLATTRQSPKCSKEVLLQMDLVSWETNEFLKRLV